MLLTCVLVSHEKPLRVHEAVRGVLAQTSPDWRLVIIDSGSLVDALRPYEVDGRVEVVRSPEGARCQGWQINHCFRQGLVTGDIVCYLSDDDVYAPEAFTAFLDAAKGNPGQMAWWAPADRVEVRPEGEVYISTLRARECLRGHIDGIQVCHRTSLRVPWPEEEDGYSRANADGIWMDSLEAIAKVYPIHTNIGRHRHCPESAHTRPMP